MIKRATAPSMALTGLVLALTVPLTGCLSSSGSGAFDKLYEGISGDQFPPTYGDALDQAYRRGNEPDIRRNGIAWLSAPPSPPMDLLQGYPSDSGPRDIQAYRLFAIDPDPSVRAICATALGNHGTQEDLPALLNMLQDDDAFVRWMAADALRKIHNPQAVPALIQRLDPDIEPDTDTRAAAADALGQYPDRVVLAELIIAMEQPDYTVAAAAERSLQTLTGQDLGDDARDWNSWAAQTPEPFADGRPYRYEVFAPERSWFDSYVTFWNNPEEGPFAPREAEAAPVDDEG